MIRKLLGLVVLSLALPAAAARYVSDRADAPVDWQPWGGAAIERAQKSGRPIFLSVGFASSWECERMHREAFLNGEVAESLNTWFVPVLLDGVEHPLEAAAFEAIARSVNGTGGWPVNLILTPALEPFAVRGAMSPAELSQMLVIAANEWAHERSAVVARGRASLDAARAAGEKRAPGAVDVATIEKVVDAIAATWDAKSAAFGALPRRPHPTTISFLIRYAARTKNESIRTLAIDSLLRLAILPLRDQLGGGFHRAARDAEGLDPAFEKMLADQALLAMTYLDAWQATGDPDLEHVVRTTLDYVVRDLQLERSMFNASQDAHNLVPAQGPEFANGAFYRWDRGEVTALVGPENAGKIFRLFDMKADERNVPHLTATRFLRETRGELAAPLERMLEVRQKRPAPFREAPAAAENGLMISALARAASAMEEKRWLEHATWAAVTLQKSLWIESTGTLKRTTSGSVATAADYACLVQGMLDLFEAGQDPRWLRFAIDLQRRQDALFWDASAGRYDDAKLLPAALRGVTTEGDGSVPSANAVSARNLLRLAPLVRNGGWESRPAMIFESFGGRLAADGAALPHLAEAYELSRIAPKVVVVTGDLRLKTTHELFAALARTPQPMRFVVMLPHKGPSKQRVLDLLPFMARIETDPEHPSIWLCSSGNCGRQ